MPCLICPCQNAGEDDEYIILWKQKSYHKFVIDNWRTCWAAVVQSSRISLLYFPLLKFYNSWEEYRLLLYHAKYGWYFYLKFTWEAHGSLTYMVLTKFEVFNRSLNGCLVSVYKFIFQNNYCIPQKVTLANLFFLWYKKMMKRRGEIKLKAYIVYLPWKMTHTLEFLTLSFWYWKYYYFELFICQIILFTK